MTILVLADAAADATAVRLVVLARQRGRVARLVSPAELAHARWAHRVHGGRAHTTFALADGTVFRDTQIGGVFNRLWSVPAPATVPYGAVDRDYANAELHALMVSWLAGLRCPVINPATPHALCGSPLSPMQWGQLAHRAGLGTVAACLTSSQRRYPAAGFPPPAGGPLATIGPLTATERIGQRAASVLVVADTAWPELPDECDAAALAGPCVRLARDAGLGLARIHLVSTPDERGWRFTHADATPNVAARAPLFALLAALDRSGA